MTRAAPQKRKASRARQASPSGAADWFPLALFGLFAVGCVATARRQTEIVAKKRLSMSFQVEADSPLYEAAQEAADKWTAALGLPVTVTPDGDIPIFLTDSPTCPIPSNLAPGDQVGGCAKGIGTPDQRIEIPTYVNPSDWPTVLLHEMGHHLRGKPNQHVAAKGALMSDVTERGQEITPADIAFVCTPPSLPDDPPALDCRTTP